MAQPGSAHAWGACGRRFKSGRPDQSRPVSPATRACQDGCVDRSSDHPERPYRRDRSRRSTQNFRHYLDLLTNCSTYDSFEACASDVFTQRVVDQRLVVAATCTIHDVLKMLDNVVIETNRDASLSRRRRHNGTASGLAEIVFPLHLCLLSYSARSRRVAHSNSTAAPPVHICTPKWATRPLRGRRFKSGRPDQTNLRLISAGWKAASLGKAVHKPERPQPCAPLSSCSFGCLRITLLYSFGSMTDFTWR